MRLGFWSKVKESEFVCKLTCSNGYVCESCVSNELETWFDESSKHDWIETIDSWIIPQFTSSLWVQYYNNSQSRFALQKILPEIVLSNYPSFMYTSELCQ